MERNIQDGLLQDFDTAYRNVERGAARMISVAFTYGYRLRMRPNSYPKIVYTAQITMARDVQFVMQRLTVQFDGREDERAILIPRYSLKVNSIPATSIYSETFVTPGWAFGPGERVTIELLRGADKPPKLRKRADGGRGMNITVALHGVKLYPAPELGKKTS